MEPRIQYATASDGVSIACWTLGEGMPFLHMPWFRASHLQLEWQIPEYRRWYTDLARDRLLVRYDSRGIGLSDRDVSDFSLEALVADVDAVADRLGLERFALFGLLHMGPVAIAYAARHPERVSHLILWCTYARNTDYERSSEIQATRAFMDTDWALYTETLAHVRLGWSEGPSARQFAKLIRESMTPEALHALQEAYRNLDVSELLPLIQAPVLVLHRSRLSWFPLEVARGLAARIPNASLSIVDGSSGAPFLEDPDVVLNAINRFLGLPERTRADEPAAAEQPASFRTILFTDMVGSASLSQRFGDAAAQKLRRAHNKIVREALAGHGGTETKHTGDGIMASFASTSEAVACAVAIQQVVATAGPDAAAQHAAQLRVRVGLNAGEPIAEEQDLFGTTVDLAARLRDMAEPGEILVSDVVRQLVAGKGFRFSDRGEQALKGFEEPVRLYAVRWQE